MYKIFKKSIVEAGAPGSLSQLGFPLVSVLGHGLMVVRSSPKSDYILS